MAFEHMQIASVSLSKEDPRRTILPYDNYYLHALVSLRLAGPFIPILPGRITLGYATF